MFDTCTKVVLVESSFKKHTGPRINSSGYVVSVDGGQILNELKVYAATCTINFVKYGLEKTDRSERKDVIVVFPMFKTKDFANPQNIIDDLRSKIVLDKHKKYRQALTSHMFGQYESIPNIPIVMAAPDQRITSLLECSEKEFSAWFNSILYNQKLINFVGKSLQDGYIFTSNLFRNIHFTPAYLYTMMMMMNAKNKHKAIHHALSSRKVRSVWVTTMRAIIAVYSREIITKETDKIHDMLNNRYTIKMSSSIHDIYKIVADNMFSCGMVESVWKICAKAQLPEVARSIDSIITEYNRISARVGR